MTDQDERGLVDLHHHAGRRAVHGGRDDPGRAPVAAGRAQAGDLRRLCRSARSGMTIAALAPSPPVLVVGAILVGVGGRQLPGRRLGADDRHHPEGLVGPLHGHLERRDRDQRGRLDVRRRPDHRRLRAARDAGARARASAFLLGADLAWRSGRCCCDRSTSDGARATPPLPEPDARAASSARRRPAEPRPGVRRPRRARSPAAGSRTGRPSGRTTGRAPTGRPGNRAGPGAPRTRTAPGAG